MFLRSLQLSCYSAMVSRAVHIEDILILHIMLDDRRLDSMYKQEYRSHCT